MIQRNTEMTRSEPTNLPPSVFFVLLLNVVVQRGV
jgi:hypothetical protein